MSPAGQEGLMGSLMKNEVILYNYVSPRATCDNFERVRYATATDVLLRKNVYRGVERVPMSFFNAISAH